MLYTLIYTVDQGDLATLLILSALFFLVSLKVNKHQLKTERVCTTCIFNACIRKRTFHNYVHHFNRLKK
jgi:hypothetical protein